MTPCPHTSFESSLTTHRLAGDIMLTELRQRCAACKVEVVYPGGTPALIPGRIPAPVPAPSTPATPLRNLTAIVHEP